MLCSACGSPNAEAARFCGSCGARLTATCPHCRADVTPGLRFCIACGGPLPEQPAPPGAGEGEAPLPSERRLVSVLFVDLENFTAIAEALDPEDVRSLQSRYFETARSIVSRYGGTLEKFIGDAVMAVWGAPAAHEDDGERAVRAALELIAAVAKLRGPVPGQRLTARAAIATGEAAVTIGVEGQGMVAGDLVNTAARLQAAAPSNGVLVDETTRRITGDALAFEPASAAVLRGKSVPVVTWRATGPADTRGRGRAAGHSGPFVGRAGELAELVDLQRRTVADGRGRLVSVFGIAGIGKSRLAWEFERHLDALTEPVALHVGRAPAYGEGITFAPLAEMVRRRARIAEGTETEVARRQLATTLTELVPDDNERQWVEPRLATLLDPGSHAEFERDELFAAWRRFFERVSEWAPALLIFEDLQWADPALLDFIDYLATWSRRHPMLIVALARPELLDRRPMWGSGHHSFTAVHLERLSDDAMAELLTGLAPGLTDEAVHHICDRAGGVPLYGVEVVRMLIDRGLARVTDGRVDLVEPLDRTQIPETLHALVSARIDALPATERGLLLPGAVLGRRFHPDALAAISGLEAGEARGRIAALVRRELLAVDDELRSPGRGQLTFLQDVVREVAYRTLSRRERRTLHADAAAHLESLHEPDLIEAVAEHLVAAHSAAPEHAEAPEAARRAVDALRQAATRAMALHVPLRALTHLEKALELVDDDEARVRLWGEAAAAAHAAARFELAEQLLRKLVAIHTAAGRRAEAARAQAQLASLLLSIEHNEFAVSELEAAVNAIADLGPDPASIELSGQLARARLLTGDYELALEWAERTLTDARELGQEAIGVDVLITRGTALVRLGHHDAGLADLNDAIAEAERRGFISAELRARNNLAWLVVSDDPHATFAAAREGMELAMRMGVGEMVLRLADVACSAALDTGDWDWALSTLAEMRDQPQALLHRIGFAVSEVVLRAMRGEPSADAALKAVEPLDPATDRQIQAATEMARAWIAFVDGRLDDARRMADAASEGSFGAEQHAAFVLAARASLWLEDGPGLAARIAGIEKLRQRGRAVDAAAGTMRAGAAALAGDATAGGLFDEAVAAWRSLRLPLHLALSLAERNGFLRDAEPEPGGAAEAEAILAELGADGLLRMIRPLAPR
jgi:class 3 adenylate cyclase/tetratricopeptide (TPR) repeat protein